jgi:hypothetical protein
LWRQPIEAGYGGWRHGTRGCIGTTKGIVARKLCWLGVAKRKGVVGRTIIGREGSRTVRAVDVGRTGFRLGGLSHSAGIVGAGGRHASLLVVCAQLWRVS